MLICLKDGTHAFWWKGHFKVLITLQENTTIVVEGDCYSGRGECLQARQKGLDAFSGNEIQKSHMRMANEKFPARTMLVIIESYPSYSNY